MTLTNIRLGDYIVRSTKNNRDLQYGKEYITGVNSQGVFAVPKGNTMGVDLAPYKIVQNGAFVYNPTRLELGSIAYRTEGLCIVSHLYMVFYLTKEGKRIINPIWLYIYFRRSEFCREVTFRNFGSQRPEFNFNDMSDIIIPLPDIETQQKYVDVYNAMLANQKSYERGLEDLKLTMDSFYDKLKQSSHKKIADIIKIYSNKNSDFSIPFSQLKGINEFGEFTNTRDSISTDDIDKYFIVDNEMYAANFMCLGNFMKFYLAYNDFGEKYLVSPACNIFSIVDHSVNPYYFLYVLKRSEFQRKCVFLGDGNTRGGINVNDFSSMSIPVPASDKQSIISNLYRSFENRRKLNEKLKAQIKDICPILIKASIEEARKEA